MDDKPVREMARGLSVPCSIIDRRPIRTVAAIIAHADLVITNDTGIMHVAAAVGTPVLSLFGPTDPHQWAPVGERHRFLQGSDGRISSIEVKEVMTNAREMLTAMSHS
jgi:ADP-heptose:LPS heptosyltransferase